MRNIFQAAHLNYKGVSFVYSRMKSMCLFFLAVAVAVGLLSACDSNNWQDPIPYVVVDTVINLNNQQYQALRLDQGHIEILGGYRGILIYRENATTYRAFEKASPHRVDEACAEVFVDLSGLFMREGCDNSIYDFEGNPSGGVAQFPLRRYNTQLEGSLLYIYN